MWTFSIKSYLEIGWYCIFFQNVPVVDFRIHFTCEVLGTDKGVRDGIVIAVPKGVIFQDILDPSVRSVNIFWNSASEM